MTLLMILSKRNSSIRVERIIYNSTQESVLKIQIDQNNVEYRMSPS